MGSESEWPTALTMVRALATSKGLWVPPHRSFEIGVFGATVLDLGIVMEHNIEK